MQNFATQTLIRDEKLRGGELGYPGSSNCLKILSVSFFELYITISRSMVG